MKLLTGVKIIVLVLLNTAITEHGVVFAAAHNYKKKDHNDGGIYMKMKVNIDDSMNIEELIGFLEENRDDKIYITFRNILDNVFVYSGS